MNSSVEENPAKKMRLNPRESLIPKSKSTPVKPSTSEQSMTALNKPKIKKPIHKKTKRLTLENKPFYFRFEFPHLNLPRNRIISEVFYNSFEGFQFMFLLR